MACAWAPGRVLLDLAACARPGGGRGAGPPARVEALAARFAGANSHGRHVARLALALSTHARSASRDGARAPPPRRSPARHRHPIDHNRHHHHSCYPHPQRGAPSLYPLEIEILAHGGARHRKQVPKLATPSPGAAPGGAPRGAGLAACCHGRRARRTHISAVRRCAVALSAARW